MQRVVSKGLWVSVSPGCYEELCQALFDVGMGLWKMEAPGDERIAAMRRVVEEALGIDYVDIPRSRADIGKR